MDRVFIRLGAVAGFLGVALGAFGAHALRARLSTDHLFFLAGWACLALAEGRA